MHERLVQLTETLWINPDHVTALGNIYRNGAPERDLTHAFVIGVDDPFCVDQPPQAVISRLWTEPNKRKER